jgi:hypothetical protein
MISGKDIVVISLSDLQEIASVLGELKEFYALNGEFEDNDCMNDPLYNQANDLYYKIRSFCNESICPLE